MNGLGLARNLSFPGLDSSLFLGWVRAGGTILFHSNSRQLLRGDARFFQRLCLLSLPEQWRLLRLLSSPVLLVHPIMPMSGRLYWYLL